MKKKISRLLGLGILFALAAVVVHAQTPTDSATVNTLAGSGIIADSWKPYILALLGIYEVIARVIPTAHNLSISGLIIKVWQTILPNRNAKVPTNPHP